MTEQYAIDIEALKLLDPNWDDLPANEQQALHHTFMFVIEAAVEVGLVVWASSGKKPD